MEHRFVLLRLIEGNIHFEPGPEIGSALRLALDPNISRSDCQLAVELLATPFRSRGPSDEFRERIDAAVEATAEIYRAQLEKLGHLPPGLSRPALCIDLDHEGGTHDLRPTYRFTPSMGELATTAAANLLIDTSRWIGSGDRVLGAFDQLNQWLLSQPHPLPIPDSPPKARSGLPGLEHRVASLESTVAAIGTSKSAGPKH